jgi:H+/gluconate symporter-like permease
MIDLVGASLSLGLLIWLAYRGWNVIALSVCCALVAAAFAAAPILATYTQVFMPATGAFIIDYFPLFLLGAIFGRLMDETGAAEALADGVIGAFGTGRAITAIVAACALLTYGGVSLFVVAFALYPVAKALFQRADIPKRLIPATIALGAFTFTMTALPGTPAIQNAIPMPYFGTTSFAAPGLGIIAAIIMASFGLGWLTLQARRAKRQGERYGEDISSLALGTDPRNLAQGEGFDLAEMSRPAEVSAPARPGYWLALAPILIVIAANYAFAVQIFPRLDTAYLADPAYGATRIEALRGIWAVIIALSMAIGFLLITNRRRLTTPAASIGAGANAAVLPIFNTASLVGFGAVVASLPAFGMVQSMIEGIGGGPLVSLAISTNVLAGLTGSASGGLRIALDVLGETYLAAATAEGIAPAALHRVTTIATGGLDALPHNGAVITLLSICGLTHRQSYGDIFMVACFGPLLALVVVLIAASLFGAF